MRRYSRSWMRFRSRDVPALANAKADWTDIRTVFRLAYPGTAKHLGRQHIGAQPLG
jgi:hypothetical protein